jgi:integrase/recombinase XerD
MAALGPQVAQVEPEVDGRPNPPHALRHTAGTLGYLHTGDLRAVQELLGHADPRMTARYAHVVDMAKRNPALFIPVKAG